MGFRIDKNQQNKLTLGVVVPARNEATSIGLVVSELRSLVDSDGHFLVDEIVVADNCSNDDTAKIAHAAGATVVSQPIIGYGHACMKAISELSLVDVIIFIDGDNAFFPADLPHLLQPLTEGKDLIIGSRTLGYAAAGSLTFQQKLGNQLAVLLIQLLWGHQYTDLGPFRVIRKEIFNTLNMQELTYGWTVEMQIKVLQAGYGVCEVPVNTRVRLGKSKISGTLKGTIGAGFGIISTIAKLRWQQYYTTKLFKDKKSCI